MYPSYQAPGGLLRIGDVAARLCVTPQTIRRWCDAGRFPPAALVTPSGRRFYRPEDVSAAIAWLNDSAEARRWGDDAPPAPWLVAAEAPADEEVATQ